MRILDIDLDLFLDKRKQGASRERLKDAEYHPWSRADVERFLEKQCGLDRDRPVRGAAFEEHDELFVHLRSELEAGTIATGFELVHADAHADLAIGTTAFGFVACEWLKRPVNDRTYPPTEGEGRLHNSTWLLYVAACRWPSDIIYVHHPSIRYPSIDVPLGMLVNDRPGSDWLQLKRLPPGSLSSGQRVRDIHPLELEPPIPFEAVHVESYRAAGPFDRVFVTRSPGYTPPAADPLYELIRSYIAEKR